MCPNCQEPLVIYEFEAVEIDHCLSCGGTWLDAGELELLTEFSGVQPGAITNTLIQARSEGKSSRRCPQCRKKLEIIHVGEERQIEIDRCPLGHGLWLDKGETVAVIATFDDGTSGDSDDTEERTVARFFANLYQDRFSANGS